MSDREAWKVWWCEEHLGLPLPDVDWCELGLRRYGTKTCRLVEMQLLPPVAASELLALKENGQTVWWCAVHEHVGGKASCHAGAMLRDCRMVKALLHIHREGT